MDNFVSNSLFIFHRFHVSILCGLHSIRQVDEFCRRVQIAAMDSVKQNFSVKGAIAVIRHDTP